MPYFSTAPDSITTKDKKPLRATIGSIVVRAQIGKMVKESREQHGWTRYELAKRAHMGETHIAKIEEGTYAVRVDIFNHLCKVLEIEAVFPLEN